MLKLLGFTRIADKGDTAIDELMELYKDGVTDEERGRVGELKENVLSEILQNNQGAVARRQQGTAEMQAGYAGVADQLVNAARILSSVADKLKADNDNFALQTNMNAEQSRWQGFPYRY